MDKLIKECVDLDQWKHSWHNEFKELEDYEKARDVIKEKIGSRISDLKLLNEGLNKMVFIPFTYVKTPPRKEGVK